MLPKKSEKGNGSNEPRGGMHEKKFWGNKRLEKKFFRHVPHDENEEGAKGKTMSKLYSVFKNDVGAIRGCRMPSYEIELVINGFRHSGVHFKIY